MTEALDPLNMPLRGSRLIEASAGTGKTWTIAALYLRLILGEHGQALMPEQILVMTFTRAATRELRERIRSRLREAAAAFRGENPAGADDPFLAGLRQRHGGQRAAAWLLDVAARNMDRAAILTIDAWCQRMLREHALGSGGPFEFEIAADPARLRLEAAQDVWRQEIYPADERQLALLRRACADPAELAGSLGERTMPAAVDPIPGVPLREHAARIDAERAALTHELKAQWQERLHPLREWLLAQLQAGRFQGNRLREDDVRKVFDKLQQWLDGDAELPDIELERIGRLDAAALRERLRAQAGIEIPQAFDAFAELRERLAALPDAGALLRAAAAARTRARLQELKARRGLMDFDDLLRGLAQALQGAHGEALAQTIRRQFPVALIDEFQDTSALQFEIFDRVYRFAADAGDSAILLIGDPKQAIYGFRGADIASYIRARDATEGRHEHLLRNHRSSTGMVQVLNRLFLHAEQHDPQAAFLYRDGARNPIPFEPVQARGRDETLRREAGVLPALHVVHGTRMLSMGDALVDFAERAAEHIVELLGDAQCGFAMPDGGFERLRASDIAVLVRRAAEAEAMARALRRRGLRSVYLSEKSSVLASREAADMVHWLRAVASPRDAGLLRAAMATASMKLELSQIAAYTDDDSVFEQGVALLQRLRQAWQRQGVLPMLRQLVLESGLAARWLGSDGGERVLTNLLHLAELLQEASAGLHGEQALLRWLEDGVRGLHERADAQQMRLESEGGLLRVVSIHLSKGLEYPYVVLPFATHFRADRQAAADAQAERERLREDVRLLYVALTRARHGIWLGAAPLRIGNAKACVLHRSALGHLLGAVPDSDAAALSGALRQLFDDLPQVRIDAATDEAVALTRWRDHAPAPRLGAQRAYTGRFERDWSIASYSLLVRGMEAGDGLPGLRNLDEAGAATPARSRPEAPWHRFARGAGPGNFVHEQLRWLQAQGFGNLAAPAVREALRERCRRSPWASGADDLLAWFDDLVEQPIAGLGSSLRGLRQSSAELEFWLPARQLQAASVGRRCAARYLRAAPCLELQPRQLHGMLMGLIDLVCEHDGRWWVIDYKTNSLGAHDADYTAEAILGNVAEHRYDVQLLLYQAALHRLLRQRLGSAYAAERHLGGAVDLYLRGLHGPAGGVFAMHADLELLGELDAMLGAAEHAT